MPWSDNESYNNKETTPQKPVSKDGLDLGKIAKLLLICGIISLLTSWYFSFDQEQVIRETLVSGVSPSIYVAKNKETYDIEVFATRIPNQSWIFIEGEVLDSNQEYLFSFGKEMSSYSGRDYEGSWSEVNNKYNIKITFPKSGRYYLRFKSEGNRSSTPNINLSVSKKNGSSLPHLWFGIITLIIAGGIYAKNESKEIAKFIERSL